MHEMNNSGNMSPRVFPIDGVVIDDDDAGSATPMPAAGEEADALYGTPLNDAELRGAPNAEMDALLARNTVVLTGEVWGMRDRRNTQDGDWKRAEMPWGALIAGGPTTPGMAAWGFSRHPVGKDKAGSCWVLGDSIGGARKAKAMTNMYAMGLDIDSGAKLDDVIARIEDLGLFCLVYTSYNHGKRGIQLKRDEVLKKLQITTDPTLDQVKDYLREFDKNRYEADFVAQITIKDARMQTADGVVIALDTPPLEKFRLIFPLAEPVKIVDLAETQAASLEMWEDKITGLAVKLLGLHFDTSCTDPSRLFYAARHPASADDWYAAVIRGRPLTFDEVPAYKKSLYTKHREPLNAFLMAGNAADGDRPPQALTPAGKSLNEWHSNIGKSRFMVADLLEAYCSDRIRVAGGEAQGHVHVECPFEHEHTSEGGTACMAVNCIDSPNEFWGWWCHHDACQGRHKLQMLEQALRVGWFEEELLFDDEFLLPAPDDEADDAAAKLKEWSARPLTRGDFSSPDAVVATLEREGIDASASDHDVRSFMRRALEAKADQSDKERITEALAGQTPLNKLTLKKMWTDTQRDRSAAEAAAAAREREAELEQAKRRDAPRRAHVPLSQATSRTVLAAAEAAAWLPAHFEVKDGWFYQKNFNEPSKALKVCRVFEVVGIAYRDGGHDLEATIRFEHRSRQNIGIVERTFRLADAVSDAGEVIARLVGDGFVMNPATGGEEGGALNALKHLLRTIETDREAHIRPKPGWTGDKTVCVTPSGAVVGGDAGAYLLVEGMKIAEPRGELGAWCEAASAACGGTNGGHMLMGLLSGLAGCAVDFIDFDVCPVIAFEGASSKGKSTAQKIGASVWGPPDHRGLLVKADATATAIETFAQRGNGAVVALDDEGASKVDAAEKQRLILQWAEGQGRGRGKRDGGLREPATWKTCFTISAEQGFVSMLEAYKSKDASFDIKAGALARVITISFDDVVDQRRQRPADADAVLAAYDFFKEGRAYGLAGPVFAEALLSLGPDEVRARIAAVAEKMAEDASAVEMRVIRVAALFIVCGEIATECGLLSGVDIHASVEAVVGASLTRRGRHLDVDRQQLDALCARIRQAVAQREIRNVSNPESNLPYARNVFGYCGNFAKNGRAIPEPEIHDEDEAAWEAVLRARTYRIPLEHLSALGVKVDPETLVRLLRDAGGLVEPTANSPAARRGFFDSVSDAGKVRNIGISGAFVHGYDRDADVQMGQAA